MRIRVRVRVKCMLGALHCCQTAFSFGPIFPTTTHTTWNVVQQCKIITIILWVEYGRRMRNTLNIKKGQNILIENTWTDLRTESIPQNLCLVNEKFASSLCMHVVVSDLLKLHRAILSRPVPVYEGVVCCQVCILIEVHLFAHAVGVVQMP